MNDSLTELMRDALLVSMVVCGPLLAIGFVVGLVTGILQAVTQIHDQSLSFVPKLVAMLAAFGLLLPWVMQHLSEYAGELFSTSPW